MRAGRGPVTALQFPERAAQNHSCQCQHAAPDVRFGSLADIVQRLRHVRYSPQSGHSPARSTCLLCAISRHALRNDGRRLRRCAYVLCAFFFG
jgi:hypothetical protein